MSINQIVNSAKMDKELGAIVIGKQWGLERTIKISMNQNLFFKVNFCAIMREEEKEACHVICVHWKSSSRFAQFSACLVEKV